MDGKVIVDSNRRGLYDIWRYVKSRLLSQLYFSETFHRIQTPGVSDIAATKNVVILFMLQTCKGIIESKLARLKTDKSLQG